MYSNNQASCVKFQGHNINTSENTHSAPSAHVDTFTRWQY